MGTKANPGTYDCYANAKPDEPIFVLLGRDPCAGMVVAFWANVRKALNKPGDEEKIKEAVQCALTMTRYADSLGKDTQKALEAFALAVLEGAKHIEKVAHEGLPK